MSIKPGWKTSEFWLTLTSVLVSGAVALGLLPNAEGEQLAGGLTAVVTGVFAVIPVALYIWGRVKVKTVPAAISGEVLELTASIEPAE